MLHKSCRRNQLAADLFSRVDLCEKLGSGIQRMGAICKTENAPYPKIEYTDTHFYIVFRPIREYLKMAEEERSKQELMEVLNERQKMAFEFIKQNGIITMKKHIEPWPNINRRTLTRDLNHLIKLGIVIRKGKGKRDVYYV